MLDKHVNQLLTNISVEYKNPAYVGNLLFPVVKVNKKSNDILVYSKADRFTLPKTILGPKAEANEIGWSSTTDTYKCKNYALKDFVSYEDMNNSDAPLKPQADTIEFLTDLISLDREKRIADLAINEMNGSSPDNPWDDTANSDPAADIESAISSCFIHPNLMIVPEPVMKVLKWHPKIVEAVKYVGIGRITTQHLEDLFEIEQVVVAKAKINTAKKGKTANFENVWGHNVVLAYVTKNPGLRTVTFGITFSWKFATAGNQIWQVRTWEEPKRGLGGGIEIQVESSTDEKIIAADCGYLLNGVISK